MALRIFNTLFLLAFLASAVVQYNDPDALPWVIIYLVASVLCVLAYGNNPVRLVAALLLGVSLVWIGILLPELGDVSLAEIVESVSMQTRAVEEAREIGGLALVAVWSAVLSVARKT
ncbi:MAG: hypothetical protein HKN19_07220 [Halioglobus sp.]|nr:hypothetical protein [Halioglobus sp.]